MITDAQICEWRKLRGEGMISAVGEYTPEEFWDALNEIERLRELLQKIVGRHDEAMHASAGDEANYHEMRRNFVLFHLTPNAKAKRAAESGSGLGAELDAKNDMTKKEIIERMRNFGLKGVREESGHFFIKPELLAEFVDSEINKERESCAVACESLYKGSSVHPLLKVGMTNAAAIIRTRSND